VTARGHGAVERLEVPGDERANRLWQHGRGPRGERQPRRVLGVVLRFLAHARDVGVAERNAKQRRGLGPGRRRQIAIVDDRNTVIHGREHRPQGLGVERRGIARTRTAQRQPARRIGQERGHDLRRRALHPHRRRGWKRAAEQREAAHVPARQLQHIVPLVAESPPPQRADHEPQQLRAFVLPQRRHQHGIDRPWFRDHQRRRMGRELPREQRRAAARQMEDEARGIERRRRVEPAERVEAGAHQRLRVAAGPALDRLVKKRLGEANAAKIAPIDPALVDRDRNPRGERAELHHRHSAASG